LHRGITFRALDVDFVVETDHEELTRYLDKAFHALGPGDVPHHLITIRTTESAARAVLFDGAPISETRDPANLLPSVMSAINRAVAEASGERVLVHASAVEHHGRTLLFPAPMEAGKSTLAAGLVKTGFRYVTDEAAAIEPQTLEVVPYPRPISIDRGSWSLLADLRPDIAPGVEPYTAAQWHVSPLSIRPDAVAPRSLPGIVAFPRYSPQSRTQARRVAPATALVELVECTFNLDRLGVRGFETLARVVQITDCYRLTVSDLGAACRTVERIARDLEHPSATIAKVVVEPVDGDGRKMAAVDAASRLRRRPGLAWIALDPVVIYEPSSGGCMHLNPTGSLLWRCLDGCASLGDLASEFAKEFSMSKGPIERAVVALARRFVRLGLVVEERDVKHSPLRVA
jgi:hypothetical protein